MLPGEPSYKPEKNSFKNTLNDKQLTRETRLQQDMEENH